jgi:hypothetical protein
MSMTTDGNVVTESVAGIPIPDSRAAREATALLREYGTPLLFAHSLRVYLFGALRGRHRRLKPDPELLYLGAVFHDLGLTPKYRSPDHRFEVDSANAARDFLRAHGIKEQDVGVVWDAIALHTTPEIPWHKRPEVALVQGGVEVDRPGVRRRLRAQARDHVRDDERRRAGADAAWVAPDQLLRPDRRQPAGWMSGAGRMATPPRGVAGGD